eukprot:3645556-Prymnesium_polylepis.1
MLQTRVADFSPDPVVLEVDAGGALPTDVSSSACTGGIFEADGFRLGHQVAWRAAGGVLELSETSLLPGVEVAGGELSLHFSSNILPDVGICQLTDGSLLLSVATSAPSGAPPPRPREGRAGFVHGRRSGTRTASGVGHPTLPPAPPDAHPLLASPLSLAHSLSLSLPLCPPRRLR